MGYGVALKGGSSGAVYDRTIRVESGGMVGAEEQGISRLKYDLGALVRARRGHGNKGTGRGFGHNNPVVGSVHVAHGGVIERGIGGGCQVESKIDAARGRGGRGCATVIIVFAAPAEAAPS